MERVSFDRDIPEKISIFKSSLKMMIPDSRPLLTKRKEYDLNFIPLSKDKETLPFRSLSEIIGLPLIVMKMR